METIIGEDFQEVEATDHEIAAYLRRQDRNWTYQEVGDDQTEYLAHGKVVGVGLFKNSPPVFHPKKTR